MLNAIPTIDQAVNYLVSVEPVTMDQVTECLRSVIYRCPDGGYIVSDEINGEHVYRKMWQVELMAALSRSPAIRVVQTVQRKLSGLFKSEDVSKKLPYGILNDNGQVNVLHLYVSLYITLILVWYALTWVPSRSLTRANLWYSFPCHSICLGPWNGSTIHR
jgi:hypothetical protein